MVSTGTSAIHITNNVPGDSIALEMEAAGQKMSSISPSIQTLKQMQRKQRYDKLRKRGRAYTAVRERNSEREITSYMVQ